MNKLTKVHLTTSTFHGEGDERRITTGSFTYRGYRYRVRAVDGQMTALRQKIVSKHYASHWRELSPYHPCRWQEIHDRLRRERFI